MSHMDAHSDLLLIALTPGIAVTVSYDTLLLLDCAIEKGKLCIMFAVINKFHFLFKEL